MFDRRRMLVYLSLFATFTWSDGKPAEVKVMSPAGRANILIIMANDLGYEALGC